VTSTLESQTILALVLCFEILFSTAPSDFALTKRITDVLLIGQFFEIFEVSARSTSRESSMPYVSIRSVVVQFGGGEIRWRRLLPGIRNVLHLLIGICLVSKALSFPS
jgi:hypothetical protein